MIYTVEQIREIAAPIAASYGIKRMTLFGSYARGEATDSSDVDILIDRGNIVSGLTMGSLYADLQEGFGKGLDLVTQQAASESFLRQIQDDEVVLYAEESKGR